jgi:hypothetical protein
MTIKRLNYLGGLPRSGSTLIATLLNQHPEVYASPHSVLLESVLNLRSTFIESESISYGVQLSQSQETLWSFPQLFYRQISKPIVVDKQFCWTNPDNYELALKLTPNPRFIVSYRPILEVLTSFVSKAVKNPDFYLNKNLDDTDFSLKNYLTRNDAMAEYLMLAHPLIYQSMIGLANAKKHESSGMIHFIHYDNLVKDPQKEMSSIFKFMGIEDAEIKTENLADIFRYKDKVPMGIEDFHHVRCTIKKESPKPEDYFSEYILKKYENALSPFGL